MQLSYRWCPSISGAEELDMGKESEQPVGRLGSISLEGINEGMRVFAEVMRDAVPAPERLEFLLDLNSRGVKIRVGSGVALEQNLPNLNDGQPKE